MKMVTRNLASDTTSIYACQVLLHILYNDFLFWHWRSKLWSNDVTYSKLLLLKLNSSTLYSVFDNSIQTLPYYAFHILTKNETKYHFGLLKWASKTVKSSLRYNYVVMIWRGQHMYHAQINVLVLMIVIDFETWICDWRCNMLCISMVAV